MGTKLCIETQGLIFLKGTKKKNNIKKYRFAFIIYRKIVCQHCRGVQRIVVSYSCLQFPRMDCFRSFFEHSFFNVFQTVSFCFWHEHGYKENADETKESEKPKCSVCADCSDQVVETLGYGKATSPVERRGNRGSVPTNFARENFSHLRPK